MGEVNNCRREAGCQAEGKEKGRRLE